MKRVAFIALFVLLAGMAMELVAQIPGSRIPPRKDDHFWRRKVINRIDLTEKINEPLTYAELPGIYGSPDFGETNGIVVALVNGLKSGKYLAYHPDSLNKSLTYEDVVQRAQICNGVNEPWEEEPYEEDPFELEEMEVEGDGLEEESGWNFPSASSGNSGREEDFQVAPFETALEFIEQRIFDKNRSAMVYDIQYIRLVWVDPGETLPDKNFICLKFSDVLEVLEDTQWKNRFNDAECRNMREIFEERIFNSYVTNVSGRGVRTLQESDYRSNQMLEYEHHLWSY